MARDNLDLLLGGLNTLGSAAGAVAQSRQPKIDAGEVARKYAQLVNEGKMSGKEGAILARMEMDSQQGLGTPAPATGSQSMRQPSQVGLGLGGGLQGPSLKPEDLALQRPPVTMNQGEVQMAKDLGLPQQHQARITAEGAENRARLMEGGRTERATTAETGKNDRLDKNITSREGISEARIAAENKRASLRATTDELKMDQAMARLEKQLASQERREAMRGPNANPERKALIQRMGQNLRAIASFKAELIEKPDTQDMVKQLWEDIKVMQDELKHMETEDKEMPQMPMRPATPKVTVGTPQMHRPQPQQPQRGPSTQSPGVGQMSDAELEAKLNEIEAAVTGR